ncbi:MAG TPA: SMC-Scp complex subunit ScpB [Candidatus Nanoarchaeia archaeon]|nr:SMC-Scp complex subunit ScpB [Candidatus Nanoarchaeia archaeon]
MAKKKKALDDTANEEQAESLTTLMEKVEMGEELTQKESEDSAIRAKIESILFVIPEGVSIEVLANKLNLGLKDEVRKHLEKMKAEYDAKQGIKLVQDGDLWRFKIPDEHTELVREAATPEFDSSILETLAYIAWRNGSRQCDVVRVRSNKAYNHIKLLREKGFIEAHKSGLSKWLQPTRKFYEYFKINPGEKLAVPEEVEKRLEEAELAAKEAEAAEQAAAEQAKEEKEEAT